MSRHTQVAPWKTPDEMLVWLKEASTKAEYQRRLVIWMAVVQPRPASQVAEALGISTQAVWKWVAEYNRLGPDGLDRTGRGGRRRSLLSLSAERALVAKVRHLQSLEGIDIRTVQEALRHANSSTTEGYCEVLRPSQKRAKAVLDGPAVPLPAPRQKKRSKD